MGTVLTLPGADPAYPGSRRGALGARRWSVRGRVDRVVVGVDWVGSGPSGRAEVRARGSIASLLGLTGWARGRRGARPRYPRLARTDHACSHRGARPRRYPRLARPDRAGPARRGAGAVISAAGAPDPRRMRVLARPVDIRTQRADSRRSAALARPVRYPHPARPDRRRSAVLARPVRDAHSARHDHPGPTRQPATVRSRVLWVDDATGVASSMPAVAPRLRDCGRGATRPLGAFGAVGRGHGDIRGRRAPISRVLTVGARPR